LDISSLFLLVSIALTTNEPTATATATATATLKRRACPADRSGSGYALIRLHGIRREAGIRCYPSRDLSVIAMRMPSEQQLIDRCIEQ